MTWIIDSIHDLALKMLGDSMIGFYALDPELAAVAAALPKVDLCVRRRARRNS
jgi:phosphate uptake regulator